MCGLLLEEKNRHDLSRRSQSSDTATAGHTCCASLRERHELPYDPLKQTSKAQQQQSVKLLFLIKRLGHFSTIHLFIYLFAFLQLQIFMQFSFGFDF